MSSKFFCCEVVITHFWSCPRAEIRVYSSICLKSPSDLILSLKFLKINVFRWNTILISTGELMQPPSSLVSPPTGADRNSRKAHLDSDLKFT